MRVENKRVRPRSKGPRAMPAPWTTLATDTRRQGKAPNVRLGRHPCAAIGVVAVVGPGLLGRHVPDRRCHHTQRTSVRAAGRTIFAQTRG